MFGRGVGGLVEARRVLDMGNSGTGARLLMGLVASQPILSFFSGDASLSNRPMRRVIEPLTLIGASVWARGGDKLPLAIRGDGRTTADRVHLAGRLGAGEIGDTCSPASMRRDERA